MSCSAKCVTKYLTLTTVSCGPKLTRALNARHKRKQSQTGPVLMPLKELQLKEFSTNALAVTMLYNYLRIFVVVFSLLLLEKVSLAVFVVVIKLYYALLPNVSLVCFLLLLTSLNMCCCWSNDIRRCCLVKRVLQDLNY